MRAQLIAAVVAIASASLATAQGAGSPTPGRKGGRMYDPSTVTTVSGEVTAIQRVQRGGREGVHATLRSQAGDLAVLLGPSFYVDQQPTKLTAGDNVEVTGSKVTFGSGPALVAQVVRKGDQVLTLRTADGTPLWAGQGTGGGPGRCAGQGCCGGAGCPPASPPPSAQ